MCDNNNNKQRRAAARPDARTHQNYHRCHISEPGQSITTDRLDTLDLGLGRRIGDGRMSQSR